MLDIILYEPEIPPNTGNIIRICANTGFRLHLIEPLGFELDDKRLRRAGLDYHEWASLKQYPNLSDCVSENSFTRVFGLTTKASRYHSDARFEAGDALLFGPETRGLPGPVLEQLGDERLLKIPMGEHGRSLNLSNAVSIVVFEAWRQLAYAGAR